MSERRIEHIRIEAAIFTPPREYSALIVYFDIGTSLTAHLWTPNPGTTGTGKDLIATVPSILKEVNGKKVNVSIFPRVLPGTYRVITWKAKDITLFPGFISEMDFRIGS